MGYRKTSRYYKYKIITIISIPIIGYLSGLIQDFLATPNQFSITGKAEIHDGDTLKIKNERIRIYGLDAPELKQKCYDGKVSLPCGLEAKKRLEEIIGNREIFCIPLDEDKYNRADSNCYFVDNNNMKVNIGQKMVIDGWALAYKTYSPRYIINEFIAKISMNGIWQYKFQLPWNWRKEIKSKSNN